MTVYSIAVVACDFYACDRGFTLHYICTEQETRDAATSAGWRIAEDAVYCPRHAPMGQS